jgi:peroxidase
VNDVRTSNTFDNKYYVDLLNREGLFTSDQDLLTNATTRDQAHRHQVCC